MKIAYLMNSYPMTSTTFIRREIEAVEALGVDVLRFAVRVWPHALVDARDRAEQQRTSYLLTGNRAGLFLAFLLEALLRPLRVAKAIAATIQISRAMGWALVRPVAYLLQAAFFARRAREAGVDHVHVHFVSNAASVAMLAHIIGGPSFSFTAHGPDELFELDRLGFRDKARRASFIVAISDYCRTRLTEACRREDAHKIRVLRCGLALEEFAQTSEPDPANRTLVCIGRLCPQKGQDLIPEAVARLAREFEDLRVVLVGDGESRATIEEACRRHGVERQVELRGWVANAEALDLLRSARALLLPSFAEGLPVVIMEALCLGRPVISTTIAGIPELVDERCGWLVPPGDTAALADAMRRALVADGAELRSKGAIGRERVTRMHDRRMLARVLRDLFEVHLKFPAKQSRPVAIIGSGAEALRFADDPESRARAATRITCDSHVSGRR